MAKSRKRVPPREPARNVRFVAKFRHWRSGKVIEAKDYGKRAFPLRKT